MSEEIKVLIFIFGVAVVPIFLLVQFASYHSLKKEVKLWSIIWITTTILAFLSPNFWFFLAFMGVILLAVTKNNPMLKLCLFFVLLPSIPPGTATIPGFGIINYLFNISFQLFLSIVLLTPLAFSNARHNISIKSVKYLILAFCLLNIVIYYQESSFVYKGVLISKASSITEVIRYAFTLSLTLLIPYYAVIKTVKSSEGINKVFYAILFGILLQACIGFAELLKVWHVYNIGANALGLKGGGMMYLSRENLLRASAALGHPITLGFVVAIGIGIILNYNNQKNRNANMTFWAIFALLSFGLLTTLSRGPWVGTACIIICYFFIANKAAKNLTKLGLVTFLALVIISFSPVGERFINLLPYFNQNTETHATSTITYRERLFEQSWKVIQKNPFFGSPNYLQTPEMEEMRQGEGIIDVVNSYLAIAMEIGLVGLSLYLLIFITILVKLKKNLTRLNKTKEHDHLWTQGRIIFATIVGIMVILYTTSNSIVPKYYIWSLIGLATVFIALSRQKLIAQLTIK